MAHRSFTGNHNLLPASDRRIAGGSIPHLPVHDLSAWTFGTGTVIWRIWPAVILHTAFAAAIVVVSEKKVVSLGIPNVLLTLLGVVIGFVISYRASSGYDRYWWGRCAWSDIIKNSRTISRLIWIHVPPQLPKGDSTSASKEIGQVMREKRIALELLEAFSVSLKHHLRGELGIYYEDLYPLVRPLHEHHAHLAFLHADGEQPGQSQSTHPIERTHHRTTPARHESIESYSKRVATLEHRSSPNLPKLSSSRTDSLSTATTQTLDPMFVPAINTYGSLAGPRHQPSYTSLVSTDSSEEGERDPLLPSSIPGPRTGASADLVPFTSVLANIGSFLSPRRWVKAWRENWRTGLQGNDEAGGVGIRWGEARHDQGDSHSTSADVSHPGAGIRHRRATRQTHNTPGKHRPRVAGDGENLPLEVLRMMSEWLSVLEARGTVGGNALGGMFGCITNFEDCLSTLERILTTPLPFNGLICKIYVTNLGMLITHLGYALIYRHTVWLYLFFLPFQLADQFHWYTIPGTAVAAFFYLGFLAAGEEIEQPFGYDENDLDLDLFCREIVRAEIHTLVMTPFPNAPMGSHRTDDEINELSTIVETSAAKHHRHE